MGKGFREAEISARLVDNGFQYILELNSPGDFERWPYKTLNAALRKARRWMENRPQYYAGAYRAEKIQEKLPILCSNEEPYRAD